MSQQVGTCSVQPQPDIPISCNIFHRWRHRYQLCVYAENNRANNVLTLWFAQRTQIRVRLEIMKYNLYNWKLIHIQMWFICNAKVQNNGLKKKTALIRNFPWNINPTFFTIVDYLLICLILTLIYLKHK